MTLKEYIKCPVCEGDDYKVLYEPWIEEEDPIKLYGAATGIQGTQRLVKCNICEMIYENPRLPKDVILKGYISTDQSLHDSQYKNRVSSFYKALVNIQDHLPLKGAEVLDIGTAGGAFLEAAQMFGYDAYGLEPSKYLTEEAQKRGLKVKQGTIDENPYIEASFDMVCLWDVIEHLVEPKKDLLKIKALLKPNGILLINYPDIGTTMAKIAGKRFWWIISVHLHHFSRTTIKKICELTGFNVFYFRTYWQTLELDYLFDMAIRYKIPTASFFKKILPSFLRKIKIKYYASQTTALARLKNA